MGQRAVKVQKAGALRFMGRKPDAVSRIGLPPISLGQAGHLNTNDDAAIPHLKKTVELDPNFAMAYATLGIAG